MSCSTCAVFGSPRVLVSCCKTKSRCAVTAEAAGSSPVVPAILLNHLDGMADSSSGASWGQLAAEAPKSIASTRAFLAPSSKSNFRHLSTGCIVGIFCDEFVIASVDPARREELHLFRSWFRPWRGRAGQ